MDIYLLPVFCMHCFKKISQIIYFNNCDVFPWFYLLDIQRIKFDKLIKIKQLQKVVLKVIFVCVYHSGSGNCFCIPSFALFCITFVHFSFFQVSYSIKSCTQFIQQIVSEEIYRKNELWWKILCEQKWYRKEQRKQYKSNYRNRYGIQIQRLPLVLLFL